MTGDPMTGDPMTGAPTGHIRIERGEGDDAAIAWLVIDRAEKRNAMTYRMLGELIAAFGELGADPSVRVVVLTGVPGAFCAGTDLADLATIPGEQRGLRGSAEDDHAWWPPIACAKPVIAAIDGPAVGMGAEYTSLCDVRIATPNARFAWNFAHRGLVPDTGAGSWLLPRLIGVQAALRLLYSGDFISAQTALELGYVSAVVEPADLPAAALAEARRFLQGSPMSQRMIKSLVYEGLGRDVREHLVAHTTSLAACFKSDDHREGVASFLERRPARFTGT
jgi:enoyl-CoA hydratase/carnithine racemase